MKIIKKGQSLINIVEYFRRNKKDINKAKLNVKASVKNEFGFFEGKSIQYRTFTINNVKQNLNNLSFSLDIVNYSTQELFINIDIINSKEELIYSSIKEIVKNTSGKKLEFNFGNLKFNKLDVYYYRVVTSCPNEGWIDFECYDQQGLMTFSKAKINLNNSFLDIKENNINGGCLNLVENGKIIDSKIPISTSEFSNLSNGKLMEAIRILVNPIEEYEYQIHRDMEKLTPINNYTNYANNNHMIVGNPYEFNNYANNSRVVTKDSNYLVYKNGLKLNPNEYRIEQGNDGLDKVYINKYSFDLNDRIFINSIGKDSQDGENEICRIVLTSNDINLLNSVGLFIPTENVGSLTSIQDLKCYILRNNTRLTPRRYHLFPVNFSDSERYGIRAYIQEESLNFGDVIVFYYDKTIDNILFKNNKLTNIDDRNLLFSHYIPYASVNNGEFENNLYPNEDILEIYLNGYRMINGKDFSVVQLESYRNIPSIILFKDIAPFDSTVEIVHNDYYDDSVFETKPTISNGKYFIETLGLSTHNYFIPNCFEIFVDRKRISNLDYDILNRNVVAINNGEITQDSDILIKFHYGESKQKVSKYNNDINVQEVTNFIKNKLNLNRNLNDIEINHLKLAVRILQTELKKIYNALQYKNETSTASTLETKYTEFYDSFRNYLNSGNRNPSENGNSTLIKNNLDSYISSRTTAKNKMNQVFGDNETPYDDLLSYLLNFYKDHPNSNDSKSNSSVISSYNKSINYLEPKNPYKPLNYIYQLSNKYNFLKQIKDDIDNYKKDNVIIKILNCNDGNNLTGNNISINNVDLPILFNHDIFINMNSSFNNNLDFEDNIAITNMSRIYSYIQYIDHVKRRLKTNNDIITINCNKEMDDFNDVFLNENIELKLNYETSSVDFNCNESFNK